MTETTSKWVDVVTKLTTLTQAGRLKWRTQEAGDAGLSATANAPFYAEYKNRRMRILKRSRRQQQLGMFSTAIVIGPDEYVSLELVDPTWQLVWTFPQVAGLEDLYAAVQYQVAGVDDILNDFLAD
jgi:hypothetical protein